ncbi:MAG: hypothetical protein PVI95_03520, partial [Dehalococcoidia bacterium]
KVDEAKTVADGNANAGLMWDEGSSTKIVGRMVKALGDIPLGVSVKGMSQERIDELASLGCDFIVFDIGMTALILQKEGVGKFLMIEPSLDQGFARAINSFHIDGVFISNRNEDPFIAVEHLLVYRRFVEILEKPVIMTLPSLITKGELTSLWQAGVVGLVSSLGQSGKSLGELEKMISEMPGKARGRRTKADVKLPHYNGSEVGDENEEEEEI